MQLTLAKPIILKISNGREISNNTVLSLTALNTIKITAIIKLCVKTDNIYYINFDLKYNI